MFCNPQCCQKSYLFLAVVFFRNINDMLMTLNTEEFLKKHHKLANGMACISSSTEVIS